MSLTQLVMMKIAENEIFFLSRRAREREREREAFFFVCDGGEGEEYIYFSAQETI